MSSSMEVTVPSSSSWRVALAGKDRPIPGKSSVGVDDDAVVAGLMSESGRRTAPLGGNRPPSGLENGSL